jgi:hypothetical protein
MQFIGKRELAESHKCSGGPGVTMSLTAGEHKSPEQVKAAIRHHMLFFVGGS